MENPQQDDTFGEVEIKAFLHDGWNIRVRGRVTEDGAGLLGAADISRDGVFRRRLSASTVFDSREHLLAVMVAQADKWVAVQASSAPSS